MAMPMCGMCSCPTTIARAAPGCSTGTGGPVCRPPISPIMMATHWHPERRQRFERPLLEHYHATLLASGIKGYDRPALDHDYRLAVLFQLITPVVQANAGIPPAVWWEHLERIMLAIDYLGCRELLSS